MQLFYYFHILEAGGEGGGAVVLFRFSPELFEVNWIDYRGRAAGHGWRGRSGENNSYYSADHQAGGVRLTPVTPEQTLRGLEPSWSSVTSRVTSTTSTTSSTAALQPPGKPRVVAPVIILLVLLLSYISSSAVILARLMGWTILQSFYFCFLSILILLLIAVLQSGHY